MEESDVAYSTQQDMEQRIGLSQLTALTNDVWQVSAPGSVVATAATGGSLAIDTYYYVVTAVSEKGETVQSSEVSATTDGTKKTIELTWATVPGARAYKVYRSTTSLSYTTPCLVGETTALLYDDDGSVSPLLAGAPTSDAFLPNAAVIATLIAKADHLIDAKAGQVYTVPFTTVPDVVKDISADLACYFALQRRPVNIEMPKAWDEAYKHALEQLEDISNMLLRLPTTATIESAESNIVTPTTDPIVDFNDSDNAMSDY